MNVENTARQPIDFPDPFIAKFGNTYYGYSTSSNISTVQVIKSSDAVNWSWVARVRGSDPLRRSHRGRQQLGRHEPVVGTGRGGAAVEPVGEPLRHVLHRDVGAARQHGHAVHRACHRAGRRPRARFVDSSSQPIVCTPERGGWIDPNPFVANGQLNLIWQSFGIAPNEATKLCRSLRHSAPTGSGSAAASQLTEVLYGSQEWPNIEGPTMMPAPGGGYLLYCSAGAWWTDNYEN